MKFNIIDKVKNLNSLIIENRLLINGSIIILTVCIFLFWIIISIFDGIFENENYSNEFISIISLISITSVILFIFVVFNRKENLLHNLVKKILFITIISIIISLCLGINKESETSFISVIPVIPSIELVGFAVHFGTFNIWKRFLAYKKTKRQWMKVNKKILVFIFVICLAITILIFKYPLTNNVKKDDYINIVFCFLV